MMAVTDEIAIVGERISFDVFGYSRTGRVREFKIPRDESGNPIGISWEEVRERMFDNLSKHYGVDLRTL